MQLAHILISKCSHLSEFDNQVQESRAQAPLALQQVPKIKQLIDEAKKKTDNARQALAGAQSNSQIARDSAQDAQLKYAEQASKVCNSSHGSKQSIKFVL